MLVKSIQDSVTCQVFKHEDLLRTAKCKHRCREMNLLEVFMSPTCLTPVNVVWIWSFNFVFLLHLLRSVEQMSIFLCPTVASFCSALPHVTGCSLTILQHMLPSPVWSFKRQRGALYWFSFGEGREAHTPPQIHCWGYCGQMDSF